MSNLSNKNSSKAECESQPVRDLSQQINELAETLMQQRSTKEPADLAALDQLLNLLRSQRQQLNAHAEDAEATLADCQQELERSEKKERAAERLRLMRLADIEKQTERARRKNTRRRAA